MVFQPRENAEPIPGYVLQQRLGAGGYGEVWKVSAPGGLTKAIKFVYGRMDDDRACRELKALGRIREVRHPFLLSLERFDVIEGQLVVVTELADMSLMDRYRACREAGTGGIPREELLAYLKDAADALDYMSEKYGLQHLDIKPENLLLVGGRVKVADFGLVKDLQDTHATAIGGVTPIYATPEAFDGKASRYSDQYSLAIVYQEMLTGELPFPGGTTAQLANQHLHSQPLLGPLSPQDRPTIARALSKQPEKRFATCRQMVDNLLSPSSTKPREPAAPGSEPPAAGAAAGHAADQHTVSLRATPAASNDETRKYQTAAPSPTVGEVPLVELEPLSLDGQAEQEQPGTRPTLFIGIGGTAGAALRRLRQRLHDRFGSLDAIPTLRFLLLDTDREALHAAQQGDDGEALAPDETLLLALRKPADYRADSDEILGWLSRRWLYNIPRSLRTEGLRPLGRLAYIDHAAEATERLRQALMAATSAESKAAAVQATGHALRDESPRVFIVSSISGGTGSGMLLDVAYTARQMLTDLGYGCDNVCGMMVHGTMLKGAANDLRKANAYATLTELNHFNSHAGAHRGGPLAGLPAGEPSDRPFGDCYLVHLGDGLTEPELALATDKVAQYLYLDAATVCGAVLDRCRDQSRRRASRREGAPRLRTFGLSVIGCNKHAAAGGEADLVCRELVNRWHGAQDKRARDAAQRPELEAGPLTSRLNQAAEQALGGSAEAFFARLAQSAGMMPGRHAKAGGRPDELLAKVDAVLGTPRGAERTACEGDAALQEALQACGQQLSGELAAKVSGAVTALVEDPRQRLAAAVAAAGAWGDQLRSLRQSAEEELRRIQPQLASLRASLLAPAAPSRRSGGWLTAWAGRRAEGDAGQPWVEYCRLRIRAVVLEQLSQLLQSTTGSLTGLTEQLVRLRQRLEQLAARFAGPPTPPAAKVQPPDKASQLAGPEFVMQFDLKFQRELLEPQGGLFALASAGDGEVDALEKQLQSQARSVVLEAMLQVDAARGLLESQPGLGQLARKLGTYAEQALPELLKLGGAKRLLAVLPAGMFGKKLAETIDKAVPAVSLAVFDEASDVVLCHEAEELPLATVASALIESRPDYAEAARRVLTRVDVPWSALPMSADHLPQAAGNDNSSDPMTKTQVLAP